jgi:hypothetical protein
LGFVYSTAPPAIQAAARQLAPLFIRNRVFTPLGHEIREGRIYGSQISEMRRISDSPGSAGRSL